MSLKHVEILDGSQMDWSPDGTKLAFVDIEHSEKRPDTLCIMNADGTNLRRIARWALDPKWSPDGSEILCSYKGYLTILNPNEDYMNDDTKIRKLNFSSVMGHYLWSSDGKTIAFSNDSGLYLVNSNGSNPRCLIKDDKGDKRSLSWSSDGFWLAYRDEEIKAIHIKNGLQRTIAPRGGYPSWNPVNNKIAFYVDWQFKHFDDKQELPTEIRIFDFDTEKIETINIGRAEICHNAINALNWSKNGKYLAFSMRKLQVFRKPLSAIYLLDLETKRLTQLIEGTHANDSSIKWSPDSSKIAVCLTPDFYTKILQVEE